MTFNKARINLKQAFGRAQDLKYKGLPSEDSLINNVSGQLTELVADTKKKKMKHLVSSQIRDRDGKEREKAYNAFIRES